MVVRTCNTQEVNLYKNVLNERVGPSYASGKVPRELLRRHADFESSLRATSRHKYGKNFLVVSKEIVIIVRSVWIQVRYDNIVIKAEVGLIEIGKAIAVTIFLLGVRVEAGTVHVRLAIQTQQPKST